MEQILFEMKADSCEEIKKLETLNKLLKGVGAEAVFEKQALGEYALKIFYEKEIVRKKTSRNAGKKVIRLRRRISVKEAEKWIDVTTAEEVGKALGVSRSTLFRRIREAKRKGEDYIS